MTVVDMSPLTATARSVADRLIEAQKLTNVQGSSWWEISRETAHGLSMGSISKGDARRHGLTPTGRTGAWTWYRFEAPNGPQTMIMRLMSIGAEAVKRKATSNSV